jgi:hypothetical protein
VRWERVALACGVEVGEGEDETCAGSGSYNTYVWSCAITGDATRELDGVLVDVIVVQKCSTVRSLPASSGALPAMSLYVTLVALQTSQFFSW